MPRRDTATKNVIARNKNTKKPIKSQGLFYLNNFLNLPTHLAFAPGDMFLKYSATGEKLQKTKIVDGETTLVDYCGNIEYEDGELTAIHHSTGRIIPSEEDGVPFRYQFQLTDHLGNVRILFEDKNQNGKITKLNPEGSSGKNPYIIDEEEIVVVNHYYPFGMQFGGRASNSWFGGVNGRRYDYSYNGKEFNGDFGLDWSDYGARLNDATIGRWGAVDPLAESYASHSPYNYTLNNPVLFIDPDGRYVSSNESYNAVGAQMDESGGENQKRDLAESFLTDAYSDSGGEISGINLDSGRGFSVSAEPGEGALVPSSFDFQKSGNWLEAKTQGIRMILSIWGKNALGFPIRTKYTHIDFAVKVGVPFELLDGTRISPERAASKAAYAANMAVIEIGVATNFDMVLRNKWFRADGGRSIRNIFATQMEREISLYDHQYLRSKYPAIPGSRVTAYSMGARGVSSWNKAVYKNGWEKFSSWVKDIFD